MNRRRTQTIGTYALMTFMCINSVWVTFYPSLVMASSYEIVNGKLVLPDNEAEMKSLLNEGNWDGALLIKQFQMPELNQDDAPPGYDATSGAYSHSDDYFTDSTQKRLKNEVYLQQLFPGYDKAEFEQYLNDVGVYQTDPHLIQDDLVTMQDMITSYSGVDCDTVPTDEEEDCKKSQLFSALDEMKDNTGKSLFAGANDSIIQDTASLIDGDHPYFDDLYSEECKEITTEQEDGDATGLTDSRVCTTSALQLATCKAERYMETEVVDSKVIMEFAPDSEFEVLRNSYFSETFSIEPCESSPEDCLEIRTLDTSLWDNSFSYESSFRVDGFEIKFAEGITITNGEVVAIAGKIRTFEAPVTLESYAKPAPGYTGVVGTKIRTQGGQVFDSDPACEFFPPFANDLTGAIYGFDFQSPHSCVDPHQDSTPPFVANPGNFTLNTNNVLQLVKRSVYSFEDSVAIPFDETLPYAYVDTLTTYRIYFERVPEVGGSIDTFVSTAIVDDIDNYPKASNINVGGKQVPVEINVFDIDLYPANEYIPANIQVTGDTVESFTITSIGRPTDQWRYAVEITFSSPGPFQITADMHRIVEQGMRPMDGEEYCQPVIDAFLESTFPGTASCDYELGQRTNAQGVIFDEPHRGYIKVMPSWGENGEPPLDEMCWEATLTVDPTSGVGISEEDKALSCAGLQGQPYDDCMRGQWCTYDDINGEYVCTDTEDGLKISFEDACANYLNNPACTYKPDQTRCEEWHEDANGDRTCLYESHFFECEVDTNGYGIPSYADEVETICGGPVNCMNGECSNIKKESNSSFAEAAVFSQLSEEMKRAKSCANESNASTCELFAGEIGKCSQPAMWGASDCCDPDGMGMGGLNVFDALKALKYLEAATENEAGVGWMSQAWTNTANYVDGTAVGEWAGSATKSITDPISGIADTLTQEITTGFESFMKTIGFDPASSGELAAKTAEMSGNAVNVAVGTTAKLGINAATQEAITSVFGEGLMQYVAQGVYNFMTTFAPTIANSIFTTAVSTGGEQVVTGFASEFANEIVAFIAEWFSVVMLVYAIYNLVVGIVYGCKERDYATTQKIKLLSNHYVGTYCAENLVLGGCLRRVQTHCLYGSPFSRIMAQQIKLQKAEQAGIAIEDYWIDPMFAENKQPDCSGFTITDLHDVNWDRVDLTEFLQITMGQMKYNPNNMPADIIPSEREAGQREGPQAGVTAIDSNIAALNVVARAGDNNRSTITAHNMQLIDPDFMPWYQAASGASGGCTMSCDSYFMYNSTSGMCELVEREEVAGNKSCDTTNGYVYDSAVDRCVKLEIKPLEPGCPPAFVLDEATGLCSAINYESVPADIICPVGTTWSSAAGVCQEVDTIPTSSDCSLHGTGYIYQDGLCVLESIANIAPTKQCPNNYTLTGNTCVYSAVQPYQVTCPAGEVYDAVSNSCFMVSANYTPASASCPPGMTIEGSLCVDRQTQPGTLICDIDDGWSLNGDRCEKTDTVSIEPNQACPEGYIPSDDNTQCQRYVLAENDPPQCPEDWVLVAGGYCLRDVNETRPAEYGCNIGFTFDGDACTRELRYPAAVNCGTDPDYLYDGQGNCVKTETTTVSATKVCSEGTLVGDVCHVPTSESPVLGCPQGFILNAEQTLCEIRETIITQPIVNCPDGFNVSGINCVRTTTVPADGVCPIGASQDPDTGTCWETIIITQPPELYCPSEFNLVGNECVGRDVVQATATCDDPEYTYDPFDKKCFKDTPEYIEAEELCAPNSAEAQAGTCSSEVTKPPVYECPIGFFYSYDLATCVSQTAEFVEPLITCETNWSYDETLKVCINTDSYVGITCEDGFTYNASSGRCERLVEIAATPYCESGYAFDGASCIRAIHAAIGCPEDYTYSELTKMCTKDEVATPSSECEPGYTLVGETCTNDDTVPPACPDGFIYQQDTNQCEIVSPLPAENSCSEPYYDNGSGCAQLSTTPSKCPNGLAYDAEKGRCGGNTPPVENYCAVGVDSGVDCRVREQKMPTCDAVDYHYDTELQQCVKEVTEQGTAYCQLSATYEVELQSERCAYYSVTAKMPNGDCQDTYSENQEGNCVRYELFSDPHYSCSPGFTNALDDQGAPILTSPVCVKYETLSPICDDVNGYVFAGGFCEKYHATPYSQRCFVEGEYRYGDACSNEEVSSLECPSGFAYSADNARCEFIQFVSYSKVCPATHTLQNGQCVSDESSAPSCPDNHTLNPSTDVCEPIIQPPICPSGYSYNASLDKCEIREEMPADGSCPSNAFDTGSGCTAFAEARCNEGYILDTDLDKCIKDESIAATPVCPEGWQDTGTGCLQTAQPSCSEGYVFNPSTDLCEKADDIAATKSCPNGMIMTASGCLSVGPPQCPELYSYDVDRNLCVWVETVEPGERCPNGDVNTGAGCQPTAPASCPTDYSLNTTSDLCEKTTVIPASQSCSPGQVDTGSGCIDVSTPTCDPGYTFVAANDRCEKFESQPASTSCPNGQTDNGSGCETQTTPSCDSGYSLQGNQCVKNETKPADTSCPNGSQDTGTGCKTTSAPSCPSGYVYVSANDQCEKFESIPAGTSCGGDEDVGNGCQSSAPAQCSSGYTLNPSTDLCTKDEQTPAAKSCPTNYTDVGNGCQRITTPTCASGYTFVSNNDRCEKNEDIPATGQCASGVDTGTGCDTYETQPRQCPNGYSPNGSQCSKRETRSYSCNTGYSFNASTDKCEKLDQKDPDCPNGYSWDQGRGECIQYVAKEYTCPSESGKSGILNGSSCDYYGFFSGSCPSGWTQVGQSGSFKECTYTRPAQQTCPSGTSQSPTNSSQCYRTSNSYTCSGAYSYNSSSKQCETTLQQTPNCDSGFAFSAANNNCFRDLYAPYDCPTGYSYNASKQLCERGGSSDYDSYTCPDPSWDLIGTTCYRTLTQAPSCSYGVYNSSTNDCRTNVTGYSYSCANNSWSLSGSTCSRTLTASPSCPSGMGYDSSVNECRSNTGSYSYDCPDNSWTLNGSQCEKTSTAAPSCTHPETYSTFFKQCRGPKVEYTYSCDGGGWTLNGNQCERTLYHTPNCQSGTSYNGAMCVSNSVGYSYDCPDNSWTLNGSTCERTLTQSPQCPTGQTYHSGNNRCQSNVQPYDLDCPNGYVRQGNNCTKLETTPPNCPNGYSYNNTYDECRQNNIDPYELYCSPDYPYNPSTGNCEQEHTQVPTCDSGWTFVAANDRCEKDELTPFNYSCPTVSPPYSLNGDRCNRTLSEQPQCPTGYTYNSSSKLCETPVQPYGFECPENWNQVGDRCERQLQHDPICDPGFSYNVDTDRCESDTPSDYNYNCPEGWNVSGNICYRYLHEDPSCTADHIFENDVCRPYEERAPVNVCLDGWTEDAGSCTRTVTNPVICPTSYLFSPQANQCTKIETAIVGFQCPDSYSLSGDKCRFTAVNGDVLMCSQGYSFEESTSECSRTQYAYPIFICPVGYDRMEDERTCQKIIDSTADPIGMSCPYAGFDLVDEVCVLVYSVDMSHYCADTAYELIPKPAGLDPDVAGPFVCEKIVRHYMEPSRSCPMDYDVYATDYCSQTLVEPPSFACPEGFSPSPDETVCTGESSIIVPPIYSCPTGYEQSGALCVYTESGVATLTCTSFDAVIIDGTCRESVLVEAVSPYWMCGNGDDASDGTCDDYVVRVPEYSCPDNTWTLSNYMGICQKTTTTTIAPSYSCQIDMTLDGAECVANQSHPAQLQCPTSAWELSGSVCTRVYTESKPADICKTDDVFRFNACYTVEYHPFVEGCGYGQNFNPDTLMCEYSATIYDAPIVICSDIGYQPIGLSCQKLTTASIIYTCSNSALTLVGTQCYEEVISGGNPQFACVDPFTDTGTDCSYSDSVDADISCPDRFYYDPDLDTCETNEVDKKPATFICPDGYDKLDDFYCQKVVSTVPPVYECIPPALLDGTMCRERSQVQIEPGYCLPPWQQIGAECERRMEESWDLDCPTGSEKINNGCFELNITTQVPTQTCS